MAVRQSLIDREQEGERLTLREALSEYLAETQDDEYRSFRLDVQESGDRLRAEEDLIGGVDRRVLANANPERSLDDVTDEGLRNTLYRILMLMDTVSFSATSSLRELGNLDQKVAAVHRVAALVYQKRNDEIGFRRSLVLALEQDRNDWRAALLLAQIVSRCWTLWRRHRVHATVYGGLNGDGDARSRTRTVSVSSLYFSNLESI